METPFICMYLCDFYKVKYFYSVIKFKMIFFRFCTLITIWMNNIRQNVLCTISIIIPIKCAIKKSKQIFHKIWFGRTISSLNIGWIVLKKYTKYIRTLNRFHFINKKKTMTWNSQKTNNQIERDHVIKCNHKLLVHVTVFVAP